MSPGCLHPCHLAVTKQCLAFLAHIAYMPVLCNYVLLVKSLVTTQSFLSPAHLGLSCQPFQYQCRFNLHLAPREVFPSDARFPHTAGVGRRTSAPSSSGHRCRMLLQ